MALVGSPRVLSGIPLVGHPFSRKTNFLFSICQRALFSRATQFGRPIAMASAPIDAASPPLSASEKEESDFWQCVMAHQKRAAKLSMTEEARLVVNQCSNAFLSTFSQKFEGFPYVSWVDYAADDDGSLILSISHLASHTKDLEENGKCCFLIMKDKLDRSDILVTYMGQASKIPELESKKARDVFLSKHPQAFWVDFEDFIFMRIQPGTVHYASGVVSPFNRTGDFSGVEFSNAKLDLIAEFSKPIANHMNKDHAEETQKLVEKAIGVRVESAKIIDLDSLGLNVQVIFQSKPIKLRVPFPRPARERKDVKDLIVEMLKE